MVEGGKGLMWDFWKGGVGFWRGSNEGVMGVMMGAIGGGGCGVMRLRGEVSMWYLGGALGALGGGNGRVMGWDEGIMRGLGGVDGGGIWYWERV